MSFKNHEQCIINKVFLSGRVNKCIYKTPQTMCSGRYASFRIITAHYVTWLWWCGGRRSNVVV